MPAPKKSNTTSPKATNTPVAKAAEPKGAASPAPAPKVPQVAPMAPVKKRSAPDAAARVLAAKELIGRMTAQGLWASPNGKPPGATLSAALRRETATQGTASRFRKATPERFAVTATSTTDPGQPSAKAAKTKVAGTKPKFPKTARAPKPTAPGGRRSRTGRLGPRASASCSASDPHVRAGAPRPSTRNGADQGPRPGTFGTRRCAEPCRTVPNLGSAKVRHI